MDFPCKTIAMHKRQSFRTNVNRSGSQPQFQKARKTRKPHPTHPGSSQTRKADTIIEVDGLLLGKKLWNVLMKVRGNWRSRFPVQSLFVSDKEMEIRLGYLREERSQ